MFQRTPNESEPSGLRGRPRSIGALCVIAAACALVAYPPFDVWPVAVVSPALLAIAALNARSTKQVALSALGAHFLVWLWVHRWMIDVTIAGWPLLALYMAAYAALFVWIIRRLARHRWTRSIPMAAIVPVVWCGLEILRGEVWMNGYPWFLIGHPTINAPIFAQSADLFGTYFTGFLVAMTSGWIVDVVQFRAHSRRRNRLIATSAVVLIALAANLGYGAWRIGQEDVLHPGPTILAIQTNLKQDNKRGWTPEDQQRDVPRFAQQTLAAFRETNYEIDLVVWPETMVPGFGFEPDTIGFLVRNSFRPTDQWLRLILALQLGDADLIRPFANYGDEWVRVIRTLDESGGVDAPFLVGSPTKIGLGVEPGEDGSLRFTWEESYNSAYLIDGEAPYQRYDKLFLTPFGETMPYISNWSWLEKRLLSLGAAEMAFDLDEGARPTRLAVRTSAGTIPLATPICFEVTMPEVCRSLVWEQGRKEADVLINLSNDGWFGATDAGRLQHVQIARFRCIENRIPMVRAVNTGLSVHIDSRGKIIGRVGNGRHFLMREAGSMTATVLLDDRVTLFARLGDLFGRVCLALAAIGLIATFIRRRPTEEKTP